MDKIKDLLREYEKKFGKESLFVAEELRTSKEEVISTGILSLDLALGIGGLPVGKIYEIYGQESSGKTTLSLIIASQFQKHGKTVAFLDAENSFDVSWAETLGIDTKSFFVADVDSLEDAFKKIEFFMKNGVDFVILDSIAAPPTVSQVNADFTDSMMGVRARVISMALSKLMPIIRKSKSSLLFVNQIREKMVAYGNPEVTPGGRALKFFASIRMSTRKKLIEDEDEIFVGDEITVKIEKNKFAPPMKKAKFLLYYDGFYTIDYVDLLTKLDLITKSGAWYVENFTGNNMRFHGKQKILEEIKQNPDFKKLVDQIITQKINSLNIVEDASSEDDGEE